MFGTAGFACAPPPPHGHHGGCVNGLLDLQPVHSGTARLLPAEHQKASLRLLFAQLIAPCLRVTNVCVRLFEFVCSCINDVTKKKKKQEPQTI